MTNSFTKFNVQLVESMSSEGGVGGIYGIYVNVKL